MTARSPPCRCDPGDLDGDGLAVISVRLVMPSGGEMIGVEELNKRWEVAATRAIAYEMSFEGDFLVLGAGARLAKVGATLDEQRLGRAARRRARSRDHGFIAAAHSTRFG